MDTKDVNFRAARFEDCYRLAELDYIASGGAIEYLFQGLVPGLTPVEIVASNLENDNDPYSYKNAFVAVRQNEIIGFALSLSADHHRITMEMLQFFPAERIEHFKDFFSSRVDGSLYLDALCVDRKYRSVGIGRKLICMTMDKARRQGYGILSLIVFADNSRAIRLYQRLGFRNVKKIELASNDQIPHIGGCLLMCCDISDEH